MSTKNTSYWIDFFLAANLPQSVATKYAMIFTDHRIQENMLEDLTKDMLYDMGIKTIGDIIAILKHAREVADDRIQRELMSKHTSENRKVKIQQSGVNKVSTTHQPISGPSVSSSTTSRVVKRKFTGDDEDKPTMGPTIKRVVNAPSSQKLKMLSSRDSQRTVTFPEKKITTNAHQDSASVSVFRRLGEGTGKVSQNNQASNASTRVSKVPNITRTIQGGRATVAVGNQKGSSVKERLGVKSDVSNKPTGRLNVGLKSREAIFSTIRPRQARKGNTISLNKSIFDRLGPKSF